MSNWTYITGVINVSPMGRTQEEKEYVLKTVLNHLPVVVGSEQDMEVHVVKRFGYNSSSSCDEYGLRTNNARTDYGARSRSNGMYYIQDNYYLIIDACLRDTYFKETFKSFQKWLCRLAKRVIVDDVFVKIDDTSRSTSYIINDRHDTYFNMFVSPTWSMFRREDDDMTTKNWCEHLMWNEFPYSTE